MRVLLFVSGNSCRNIFYRQERGAPMKHIKIKKWVAYLLVASMMLGTACCVPSTAQAKSLKNATFAYLDVGQGNAELIKIGSSAVLIDTGKSSEYDELKQQLKNLGVTKINTLVVSHPDADHMESADDVIATYHVKKVIMPKVKATTQCYKRLLQAVSTYGVKTVHPTTGSTIKLASSCKGKILSVDAGTETNEASIVMRVTYGSRSFLYMGDATAKVEGQILAENDKVASDVYLLSHHGSDTANGALFVKKALASKYKTAIISVGANNSYGHPVRNVVRRAEKYADHVYRTDQKGCIIAKTNGNTLKFSFKKVSHSSGSSSYRATGRSTKSTGSSSKATKKSKKSSSSSSQYVYITKTGSKYHQKGCRYLRSSMIKVKLVTAKAKGLTPCSVCGG